MERVATVALHQDSDGRQVRLGQVRYRMDPERPERHRFLQNVPLPDGGAVTLDSECADSTGTLSMLVRHADHEVLRAICRWGVNDPPFLRVRLHGIGMLTLQFVSGLVKDAGPELGPGA
jgi:hypothetical protein